MKFFFLILWDIKKISCIFCLVDPDSEVVSSTSYFVLYHRILDDFVEFLAMNLLENFTFSQGRLSSLIVCYYLLEMIINSFFKNMSHFRIPYKDSGRKRLRSIHFKEFFFTLFIEILNKSQGEESEEYWFRKYFTLPPIIPSNYRNQLLVLLFIRKKYTRVIGGEISKFDIPTRIIIKADFLKPFK